MKVNNVTLGIVAALFVFLILAVVGLEITGRDPENVLYLGVAVLVPTVTGIIGIKVTGEVKSEVRTVKRLVNGNTSRLLDRLEAHGEDVSAERAELAKSMGEDQ